MNLSPSICPNTSPWPVAQADHHLPPGDATLWERRSIYVPILDAVRDPEKFPQAIQGMEADSAPRTKRFRALSPDPIRRESSGAMRALRSTLLRCYCTVAVRLVGGFGLLAEAAPNS
jgi:hypothetical protein